MATKRKIWSISLPPKLEREIKKIVKEEEKTKSEIVREALRAYLNKKRKCKR